MVFDRATGRISHSAASRRANGNAALRGDLRKVWSKYRRERKTESMKTTIIKLAAAALVGYAATIWYRSDLQARQSTLSPEDITRECWYVFMTFAAGTIVVLLLPQIWKMFLRGTSDLSKAVQGKDVGR
jgi:hypothetical protein